MPNQPESPSAPTPLDAGPTGDQAKTCAYEVSAASVLPDLLPGPKPATVPLRETCGPGDPASDPAATASVQQSGRYLVLGEIARGGMGAVLRGRDLDLGRDLAFKVLLDRHRHRPDILQRFVEEAQVGGQLQHPGIVPVYELGQFSDHSPYFTMKLVEGRTLSALLAERPEPSHDLPPFLKIFEQVCQTLAYAHSRGVIHRDLKPLNVMVGAFGEVQVMDWGLAKVLDAANNGTAAFVQTVRTGQADGESQAGAVLGTPAYMAPEQARGEVERLDERCDVFGLGAILCEILTGKPPFAGRDMPDTVRLASQADMTSAFGRLAACKAEPELVALAQSCLAGKPEDRPRDARVVAERVTAYLASVQERLRSAELARAAAQAKAAEERKRRRLTLVLAASILSTVFLGVGGAWWYRMERDIRENETARLVNQALEEAHVHRGQAKAAPAGDLTHWAPAEAAMQRAQALLASGPAADVLVRGVKERARELEAEASEARRAAAAAVGDQRILAALEDVRLRITDVRDGGYDTASGDPAYEKAFREYGIDVEAQSPGEVAEKIRARPIREQLAGAFDDWARIRRIARRNDSSWKRLDEIARLADPDPWRNQLRDALAKGDARSLKELATTADIAKTPVYNLELLANGLVKNGAAADAIALLTRAQRQFPGDFWINHALAWQLAAQSPHRYAEAVRFYTAALAIRPKSPGVYANLGCVLYKLKDYDELIAVSRQALQLKPDYAEAHVNMANGLAEKGEVETAIELYREAIRLKPDLMRAYANLLDALRQKKELKNADVAEAIAGCRHILKLNPYSAHAYRELGILLCDYQRKHQEAVDAFQRAIDLDPTVPQTYYNLNIALRGMGAPPEKIIEALRGAIHVKPSYAEAHYDLAAYLHRAGDTTAAIAEYREAIQHKPDYAEAWCNLGHRLRDTAQYDEALDAFRKGHDLGTRRPDWTYSSAQWLEDCQRLVALNARLPALLKGETKPATPLEAVEFARICYTKKLHATSARLCEEAFATQPALADDPVHSNRYDAACHAALAGCGKGEDADTLDAAARARWRQKAFDWLHADLAWRLKRATTSDERKKLQASLEHWKRDRDLAGVREDLDRLPEDERAAWQTLWAQVEAALNQKTTPKQGKAP